MCITGCIQLSKMTIDLNSSELQYLANHLTSEECRKLVASAHFKAYMMPPAVGQAEQELPKDISCIKLLHHWNSAVGEGRGETHEVLEHRLREMGKYDLADWLGKTVFHQLGEDLEDSLRSGLKEFANETTGIPQQAMPTLSPTVIKYEAPDWTPFDTICFVVLIGLLFTILGLCFYALCLVICRNCKIGRRKKKSKNSQYFEMLNEDSASEEDKFDVRETRM